MPNDSDARGETGPFDLSKTPIHLGSECGGDHPATPLPRFGFDPQAFEAYMAEHCTPGAPGRLIMIETTPEDWPAWECHPEGDEIVIVLEGAGTFRQELDGQEHRTPIVPGLAIVNPRGVWHTADVSAPMRAIYITPCPGTHHRPR